MKRFENEYVEDPRKKGNLSSIPSDMYFTERKSSSPVTVEFSKGGEYSLAGDDCQMNNDHYKNWEENPSKKRTVVSENREWEQKRKTGLGIQKKWIIVILLAIVIVIIIIAVALKMSLKGDRSAMFRTNNIPNRNEKIVHWLSWDQWGECNSNCDGGKRARSRKCNSNNSKMKCKGVDYELQACNVDPCSHGSCCSVVTVDLEGPTFKEHPELGGNYEFRRTKKKYGHMYKNIMGSGMLLFNSTKGHWEIKNSTSSGKKNVYHPTCRDSCPTTCSKDWMYWNGLKKLWKVDKLIKIECETHKCCTSLRLSHNKNDKHQWFESFGVYRYLEKDAMGANIYGHKTSKRYIVRDHTSSIWKIADGYGKSKSYYLKRKFPDGYFCPEDGSKNSWEYYDNYHGEWMEDNFIRLDCENDYLT